MKILTPPGVNPKLGPNVVSWSRPVGLTCPTDCPFLTGVRSDGTNLPSEGLCYADRLEQSTPSVAASWARNSSRDDWAPWAIQLRGELEDAARAGHAVRIHVGGDFLLPDGRLDEPYVATVFWAFAYADPRPPAWAYTHCWRELAGYRKWLVAAGIEMFASVHTAAEATEARALGYRLAIDGGDKPDPGFPAWRDAAHRELNCPEQRLGPEKITCSSCKYCFRRQEGDVIFYLHGPGTINYTPGGKHHEG